MPTSENWPPPGKSGISGALEYLAQRVIVRNLDGSPAPEMRVVVVLTEDGTAVHEVTVESSPVADEPSSDQPEDTEGTE